MIHAFKMHGTNMVLDINSGSVHVFDDISYDVLSCYGDDGTLDAVRLKDLEAKYSRKDIEEACEEIEALRKNNLLFTSDPYAEMVSEWTGKTVTKALCLHIAHDCNLRCSYCFAGTGEYMGRRSLMSPEVGKRAIDFLIENSGNRKNLEVDFFGGEPLMNFEAVKEIVRYAKTREKEASKNFRFTITTNGLLLDEEKRAFINEHMHNVVISLDGRKEINDSVRKRVDGTGSYDRVLPLALKLAQERRDKEYYVRGTFTRQNLDFSNDVLHLADLGFDQISIEPVVAAENSGIDIRREDLETVFQEYEKLAKIYVERRKSGKWFNFFHFMIDLEGGPCIAKRLRGCGSGTEYLAVTPEGDLYPCHQFVGQKEFLLGNVFEGFNNNPVVREFRKTNVYTKPQCNSCWAKFYCSGGCAANAYQFNKSIKIPYDIGCELEKKRVECALWIKYKELEEENYINNDLTANMTTY